MNKNILKTGVQSFIKENINTDIVSVLLKKPFFEGVSQKELAEQLEARKKCEKKLPTWFKTQKIYFPKKLNVEQSSSELTAGYKSKIISGKTILDLTGGFGVDSYFFSKTFKKVFYQEINPYLAEITTHNFQILKAGNINVSVEDGISFLKSTEKHFDWVFIDPSRRNEAKGKVFRLEDCTPNVVENLENIFEKSNNILLKTSPLLDFTVGLKALRNVLEIHVVAVNNEVKELLWVLRKGFNKAPELKTTNITRHKNETFNFYQEQEKLAKASYTAPKKYLYEPNAAILKSGGFKLIAHRFALSKLHPHSHLYTSEKLIDFPGRRFRVEDVFGYGRNIRKKLKLNRANITTRNFPESVDSIRKRLKLKDGGNYYFFCTKDLNNKLLLIKCQKSEKKHLKKSIMSENT